MQKSKPLTQINKLVKKPRRAEVEDLYVEKFRKQIILTIKGNTKGTLSDIINKIYEDGFNDGFDAQ